MNRPLAAAAQSALAAVLLAGLLVGAAPFRLPALAPESPVAPPGTRAVWVWSPESPEWALDPARALAWRDTVVALGLFRGLHLDVEPYLLPDWETRRDAAPPGCCACSTPSAGETCLRRAGPPVAPGAARSA